MAVKPPPVRKRRRRRTKKRRKRRRRRAKSADAAQKAAQKAPTPPPPAAVLQAVRTRSDGRQGAQSGSEGAETAPNDGRRVCKRRPAAIQAAAHSVHQRTEFKAFGALDGILTGCDGMKAAVGGVKKKVSGPNGRRRHRRSEAPRPRAGRASIRVAAAWCGGDCPAATSPLAAAATAARIEVRVEHCTARALIDWTL